MYFLLIGAQEEKVASSYSKDGCYRSLLHNGPWQSSPKFTFSTYSKSTKLRSTENRFSLIYCHLVDDACTF